MSDDDKLFARLAPQFQQPALLVEADVVVVHVRGRDPHDTVRPRLARVRVQVVIEAAVDALPRENERVKAAVPILRIDRFAQGLCG